MLPVLRNKRVELKNFLLFLDRRVGFGCKKWLPYNQFVNLKNWKAIAEES